MGGHENDHRHGENADNQQGAPGNEQRAEASGHEIAEVQQSAQREGLGNHRHRSRANEELIDTTDAAERGGRESAAADEEQQPPR